MSDLHISSFQRQATNPWLGAVIYVNLNTHGISSGASKDALQGEDCNLR